MSTEEELEEVNESEDVGEPEPAVKVPKVSAKEADAIQKPLEDLCNYGRSLLAYLYKHTKKTPLKLDADIRAKRLGGKKTATAAVMIQAIEDELAAQRGCCGGAKPSSAEYQALMALLKAAAEYVEKEVAGRPVSKTKKGTKAAKGKAASKEFRVEDFWGCLVILMPGNHEARMQDAFVLFDSDNSNSLDQAELTEMCHRIRDGMDILIKVANTGGAFRTPAGVSEALTKNKRATEALLIVSDVKYPTVARSAFYTADADHSGTISVAEWGSFIQTGNMLRIWSEFRFALK